MLALTHVRGRSILSVAAVLFSLAALSLLSSNLHPFARTRASGGEETNPKEGFAPARLSDHVSVRAADPGNPTINLSDGHQLLTSYVGPEELRVALEQNRAEPLSLASADFDEDGVPDLVGGYGDRGRGIVTVLRGNADFGHPNTAEAQRRRANGIFSEAPFLSPAGVFAAPLAADFIGAGDFDADGHWDIVTATRGASTLCYLLGDGHGDFPRAHKRQLAGVLTTMITGDLNRADGLTDVVVGVLGPSGAQTLVYEGPNGAMNAEPEAFAVSAPVSAVAVGQLDNDHMADIAVGGGRSIWLIHGRDRKLSLNAEQQATVRVAAVEQRLLKTALTGLTSGEFSQDDRADLALINEKGEVWVLAQPETKAGEAHPALQGWLGKVAPAIDWSGINSLSVGRVGSVPTDSLVGLDSSGKEIRLLTIAAERAESFDETGKYEIASGQFAETRLRDVSAPKVILSLRLNGDALNDLVVLEQGEVAPVILASAPSAIITVNSSADTDERDDLLTLREAILLANGALLKSSLRVAEQAQVSGTPAPGLDEIRFNIPANGQTALDAAKDATPANDRTRTPGEKTAANSSLAAATRASLPDPSRISNNSNLTYQPAAQTMEPGENGRLSFSLGRGTEREYGPQLSWADISGPDSSAPSPDTTTDLPTATTSIQSQSSNPRLRWRAEKLRSVLDGFRRNELSHYSTMDCVLSPIGINQVVSGSLTNTDCQSTVGGSGYFADRFAFTGTAGQAVTISLTSSAFDTFLYLLAPNGSVLVADDDGGVGTNSRIPFGTGFLTLPFTGTYTIEATSFSSGSTGSYTLSLTTLQTDCTYSLSKSSESFSGSGGSNTVTVTAGGGCNWTATSNSSFITITSGASGSGNGVVSYSVADNTSGTGRSGSLTIAGQTFIVTQSPGATCSFSLSPTSQNIGAGASSGAVSVVTSLGCSWTAVSNDSFITIDSGVSGSGNGTVRYSVSANGGPARVGTVTIAGRTFTINQAAGGTSAVTITSIAPAIPTVRPFDQSVTVFGSGFQPGLTVSVTFPFGGAATLSGTQIQNVTSTSFVMIATLGAVGNWTIRVNNPGGGQSNIFAFPVQAGGANPAIASISPTFPIANGADQLVNVSGSGFQPGLTVTVTFAFGGSATLSGTQIQNVTPTSFVMIATLGIPAPYTIRVTNPDLGQSNVFAFTVVAASGGCNYLIAPRQQQFGTGGGDGGVNVMASPGCGWTATSSAGFISITSGASGTGDGAVRYTVASNTGAARMGTLTIGDQVTRQTFTVTQGAGSPNLRTITLVRPLPKIIDPVIIDGTTQPSFAGTPIIELNGISLRNDEQGGDGLHITAGSSTIKGLVLNRFSSVSRNSAIALTTHGNNVVEGCYVGPDPSGTVAFSLTSSALLSPGPISVGISIGGSNNNHIGGTTSSARNLISGVDGSGVIISEGATGNSVQGNYIGTDVTGSSSLGLQLYGVVIQGASGNTIGGTVAGAGNLISGNKSYGVFLQLDARNNLIVGNIIGTNGAGTISVGNEIAGVFIHNSTSALPGASLENTIGGTTAAARNLISGNEVYGVVVGVGATGTLVQGNYIGTDRSGSVPLGNGGHGVTATQAPGTTVGGAGPGARNVISGNLLSGVNIGLNIGDQTGGTGTTVQGNYIGVDAAGTGAVGNQWDGIFVELNSDGNTIQENRIAFNGHNGIRIPNFSPNPGAPGVRISLLSNEIYSNTALGIDLGEEGVTPNDPGDTDIGANFQQNFPVLTSFLPVAANPSNASANELGPGSQWAKRNSIASAATLIVSGDMTDAKPNTTFTVHWYFSADSQCATNQATSRPLLSNKALVTTDGNGNGTFSFPFDFPAAITNGVINCTATDPQGNTSEFSRCLVVPQWQPVVVTSQQIGEIKAWTVGGRTSVYVKPQFPDAGHRVTDWGQVVNAGNDFTVDASVEKFTGASIQSMVSTARIYDLGTLANGVYNFNFKTSGTLAKTLQFTVSSTVPPANPIDDARQFVKQQYRDFLNREADQAGEDFWTDNITKCSDPARRPAGQTVEECTLRQRETTTGAFFQSPEFQYTGYFVYRMYQGALGRQPKLSEFIPDAQFVGNGIVVSGQLSGANINQNKAAFAAQFVNCTDTTKYRCSEFKAIYDGLSNQQFVDKLFQTTGVNASASDRAALLNGLNANPATETRASALQKIVDGINVISEGNQQFTTSYGQAFYSSQLNRAFVQLEYFGYMKRDPDEAGYAFWLDKLNTFGGNFVNAEMVLAFISSPEYRARFGQP